MKNCDVALIQEPWTYKGAIKGLREVSGELIYSRSTQNARTCILIKEGFQILPLMHHCSRDLTTKINTQQELLMWYDTITRQNYFTHKEQIVVQQDGLAMGAPSSGLIAEIFLQHMEHSHLPHLTYKHKIVNYCRYVDDILLIMDSNHSNKQDILDDFNSLHPRLQFTAETEKDTP
jgi:hypothetical protein